MFFTGIALQRQHCIIPRPEGVDLYRRMPGHLQDPLLRHKVIDYIAWGRLVVLPDLLASYIYHTLTDYELPNPHLSKDVAIALGAKVGDRVQRLDEAIKRASGLVGLSREEFMPFHEPFSDLLWQDLADIARQFR